MHIYNMYTKAANVYIQMSLYIFTKCYTSFHMKWMLYLVECECKQLPVFGPT